MIPRTPASWQTTTWQNELAQAISDPTKLLQALDLPPSLLGSALTSAQVFPLRVPRGYVARMQKGDPHDPLLRQVLPLAQESLAVPGFSLDAVGDLAAMAAPGLLHKYHGRVLLVTTGACAIHCRYCFRRHFPYAEANPALEQWGHSLDYIRADPSIKEVILSGGDPLSLSDARLASLVERLAAIPHLKYLRIHTRLPIVLPERITDELLHWLTGTRLKPTLVIHANHANELDHAVRYALGQLTARGVVLLNQSVLLRGVNDSSTALAALSEALFDAGVLPYYLHLLDKVQGAAHFEVPVAEACALMEQLRATLPGYLVPRLVREQAGADSKLPVSYTVTE
ncbi:MAG TPA: EF-P beta-lysylation protein EpmB [Gammaproteobacteria bacterium]|nr:EF-P beta-lysylation protein EpmB [Gammaproteobacteria bacterium]